MSEFKHLDLSGLLRVRRDCEKSINYHSGKVSGQKESPDEYITRCTITQTPKHS